MPDLTIGATFPGETLAVAVLNYASVRWEHMDPEIRKRWDVLTIEAAECVFRDIKAARDRLQPK